MPRTACWFAVVTRARTCCAAPAELRGVAAGRAGRAHRHVGLLRSGPSVSASESKPGSMELAPHVGQVRCDLTSANQGRESSERTRARRASGPASTVAHEGGGGLGGSARVVGVGQNKGGTSGWGGAVARGGGGERLGHASKWNGGDRVLTGRLGAGAVALLQPALVGCAQVGGLPRRAPAGTGHAELAGGHARLLHRRQEKRGASCMRWPAGVWGRGAGWRRASAPTQCRCRPRRMWRGIKCSRNTANTWDGAMQKAVRVLSQPGVV